MKATLHLISFITWLVYMMVGFIVNIHQTWFLIWGILACVGILYNVFEGVISNMIKQDMWD